MKRCEKCGIEYPSEKNYCPKCGEKLVDFNVCQRCGAPVELEDTFCSNCGYEIEKECFCPKCSAKIDPSVKFCPECGAKITKPEIKIAQRKAPVKAVHVHKEKKEVVSSNEPVDHSVNPLFKKISFIVMGSVTLLLLTLMFVGCFGDVYSTFYSETGSVSYRTSKSIAYFFTSEAFTNISNLITSSGSLYYGSAISASYAVGLYIFAVFEYLLWVLAIVFVIIGLVKAIIRFIKGLTRKTFEYDPKNLINTLIFVLPYPLFIALEYCQGATMTSSVLNASAVVSLGWGTGMILVCSIIAVVFIAIYKILLPIFSKDKYSFIGNVVLYPLAIALFIVFVISIGRMVNISYHESLYGVSVSLTGHISPFQNYVTSVQQQIYYHYYNLYSTAYSGYTGYTVTTVIPGSIYWSIVPVISAIVLAFFGLFMVAKMLKGKKVGFFIFAGITLVVAIVAYTLAYSSTYALASDGILSITEAISKESVRFSTSGIFVLILIPLTIAGMIVASIFWKKKRA